MGREQGQLRQRYEVQRQGGGMGLWGLKASAQHRNHRSAGPGGSGCPMGTRSRRTPPPRLEFRP